MLNRVLERSYNLPHKLTTFEKIEVGINASALLASGAMLLVVFYQPVIKPAIDYFANFFK